MLAPYSPLNSPVNDLYSLQNTSMALQTQSDLTAEPEICVYGLTREKNYDGIYVLKASRAPGEVIGEKFLKPLIDKTVDLFRACLNFYDNFNNFFCNISPFNILPMVGAQELKDRQVKIYPHESVDPQPTVLNSSNICPLEKSPFPFIYGTYFGIFDDAYTETMKISDQIPWYTFNRINIAFVTLDTEGNLSLVNEKSAESIKSLVSMARKGNPDAEIFVVSNYDDDMDSRYLKAAENPSKFAASVLKFLQDYGLDGYDMDWETAYINAYSKKLKALLKACYDLFQLTRESGHHYKVTHAVWPGVHSPETVGLLADSVDGINIMSYAMPVAGLENLTKRYAVAGFPFKKMIVGRESEMDSDTKETIQQVVEFIEKYKMGVYFWRAENDSRNYTDSPYKRIGPSTFQRSKWLYEAIFQKK